LYGKSKAGPSSTEVPEGYGDEEVGRPEEKVSNINTQENPFGKDRLGKKEIGSGNIGDEEQSSTLRPGKKVAPLALESKTQYYKNKSLFQGLEKKKLIYEQKTKDLLDESNLLPEDPADDD